MSRKVVVPRLFRYAEDRIPVVLIVLLSLLDGAVFLFVDHRGLVALWMLLALGPKACICSWNHHHQHVPTFRITALNRVLEVLYALHTGISTHAWVLHHNLGHHVHYLDQTQDESAWKDRKGRRMGVLRYTFTIAGTGYWRALKVGLRHRKFLPSFLGGGACTLLLVALLLWVNWFNALMLFVLPMVIGLLVTSWHTYYHHSGLDTADHVEASNNILHRWYNIFTGNLGYHTAHHMKPGLHWSKLPEYHATIAGRIPPQLFVKPCVPFRWLPG